MSEATSITSRFFVFRTIPHRAIQLALGCARRLRLDDDREHENLFDRPLTISTTSEEAADFCSTNIGGVHLISSRAIAFLREHGTTGFETLPTLPQQPSSPANYFQLLVTGWGGIADSDSGIKAVSHEGWAGIQTYTMATHPERIVDVTQWDGSDFFIVWPLARMWIVTSRIVDLLTTSGLTGFEIERLEDQRIRQTSPISRLGIGPLRMFLPEEKARRLGEPLGIY